MGGIEIGMRILLKYEVMCVGNVFVIDIYNCLEVELWMMVECDRCLCVICMGCLLCDIVLCIF